MTLVRVYCGLGSADQSDTSPPSDVWLTVAVVDDSGRLLDICEVSDDAGGYAELSALLSQRSAGQCPVAVAADSEDHVITQLLTAAGRDLAYTDDDSADDYAERFADDESPEEIQSNAAERRAVGLARALQAGVLSAHSQSPPRDMLTLKPLLAAHAALVTGRQGAAATLREVLRELYPAALRAYPDPAEPIPLAILDALPEPGIPSGSTTGRGRDAHVRDLQTRDAQVVTALVDTGVADAETLTQAVTALRVAIAETPRRTGITRAMTSAVAETIQRSVSAVRACDAAAASLIGVLADRMTARRPALARQRTAAPAAALRPVPELTAAATPATPTRSRSATRAAEAARADLVRTAEATRSDTARVNAARAADVARATEAARAGAVRAADSARIAEVARAADTTGVPGTPTQQPEQPALARAAGGRRRAQAASATKSTVPAPASPVSAPPAASTTPANVGPTNIGQTNVDPANVGSSNGAGRRAAREDTTSTTPPAATPALTPATTPGRRSAEPRVVPAAEATPAAIPPTADPMVTPGRPPLPIRSAPAQPVPITPVPTAPEPITSLPTAPPPIAPPPIAPEPVIPPIAPAASTRRERSTEPVNGMETLGSVMPPPPPGIAPLLTGGSLERTGEFESESGAYRQIRVDSGAFRQIRPEQPPGLRPAAQTREPSFDDERTEGFSLADDLPVPVLDPGTAAPGSRSTWALTPPADDAPYRSDSFGTSRSEAPRRTNLSSAMGSSRSREARPVEPAASINLGSPLESRPSDTNPLESRSVGLPRQREGRVTPPWQADDLPAEPPGLRLVEPAPLPDPTRSVNMDYTGESSGEFRLEPPTLRLVEPEPERRFGEADRRLTEPERGSRTGSRSRRGEQVQADTNDAGDGDLLIFAAARSAWFTDHEDGDASWGSADVGWRAAEQAAAPLIGEETHSGLPRRVPQQNLVPGSPVTANPERPLRIVRDAASIAANTTGYFRGWRRGQEVGGYSVGGRPGRESAGGWDFSRETGESEDRDYEYRSARR